MFFPNMIFLKGMASASRGSSSSGGSKKPAALNLELPTVEADERLCLALIPDVETTVLDGKSNGQWQLTNTVTAEVHTLPQACT